LSLDQRAILIWLSEHRQKPPRPRRLLSCSWWASGRAVFVLHHSCSCKGPGTSSPTRTRISWPPWIHTKAPDGVLVGLVGMWLRTARDPCGPGRTSVLTAPISGQGPSPSIVRSRRPCAILTSAPRVGPFGSHALSSGSSVPRPTYAGIFVRL
jgi:hypothetical protein